jgi:hypothetical protein
MNSNTKQGTKRRRGDHRCSHCKKTGHIRTACPALVDLDKYQKRGADHYWNKKGKLKRFTCVLGTYVINTGEMDWCWSQDKCPECIQVRLMGLELKKLRFLDVYDALPDRCSNCDGESSLSETEGHRDNTICQKDNNNKCSIQGCKTKSDLSHCDGCKSMFCKSHYKLQYMTEFTAEIQCKKCGGISY